MPVDPKAIFLGEVGLSGEVRGCSQVDKRIKEASRLGFDVAMLPQKNIGRDSKGLGSALVAVETLRAAVDKALLTPRSES
jgi:DNA repair protein RadA/Sms